MRALRWGVLGLGRAATSLSPSVAADPRVRVVFGSEAPGSGTSTMNPETGRPSDDLVPVIERMEFLTSEDRRKILHANALGVFPLLAARLRPAERARA